MAIADILISDVRISGSPEDLVFADGKVRFLFYTRDGDRFDGPSLTARLSVKANGLTIEQIYDLLLEKAYGMVGEIVATEMTELKEQMGNSLKSVVTGEL